MQTGTDAWADRQPIFEVTWGAEALELAIYRGTGRSWWMGMAVTDPPQGRDGWTGEDCLSGDVVDGEPVLYCHPVSDYKTTLLYGGPPDDLTPGEQTALPDSDYLGRVTFYFFETTSESCWVGGHRPDYYTDLCSNAVSVIEKK